MTMGQRLAALRKEKGMSQEALGEALGVSRQAISKWESDQTLPEIDKLVALSRLFGVSVGALLGVEEETGAGSGQLTEEQLRMAREIAGKYIEAFPPPPAPEPRKLPDWVKLAAAAAVLVLAVLLVQVIHLSDAVSILRSENSELQNRVSRISGDVDRATSDMTQRMEEILKKQNELVADSGFSVLWADYGTGRVQLSLYALPRNFTQGMTARFTAGEQSVPARLENGRFDAVLELNLYEELPPIYVHFEKGEERSSQHLEDVYLFNELPYPDLWVDFWGWGYGDFWNLDVSQSQTISASVPQIPVARGAIPAEENHNALYGERYGVGLFVNGEPLWFSPVFPCQQAETEDTIKSYAGELAADRQTLEVPMPALQSGDLVQCLTGVLDNYGRLHTCEYWHLVADDSLTLSDPGSGPVAQTVEVPGPDSPMGRALLEHLTAN